LLDEFVQDPFGLDWAGRVGWITRIPEQSYLNKIDQPSQILKFPC